MLINFEPYLRLLDTFRENRFSVLLQSIRESILATLNSEQFSALFREYLVAMDAHGEPFKNFSHEPGQVTQVKKIINALYHAELVLRDLESINLRDGQRKIEDLRRLYNHTIHHIYLASYPLVHMDLDLKEIFAKEMAALAPLYDLFCVYAKTYQSKAQDVLQQVDSVELSHKLGVIGGNVVYQLKPNSGKVDYEFLTQFSAALPGYLSQFTEYVRQFTANVVAHEPMIDKQQLSELQNHALELLTSLERLQGNSSFFLSLKAINYIHIIRHTITLSMSIFEHVGYASDSTQDLIRDKLSELKYGVFLELFCFVDKLEEEAMLTPGVLSRPLMRHCQALYDALMVYATKVADFSQIGAHLVTIEDAQFVRLRLQQQDVREAKDQSQQRLLEHQIETVNKFFTMLRVANIPNRALIDFLPETKRRLGVLYQEIQPYLLSFDPNSNQQIIAALTQERPSGVKGAWSRLVTNYISVEQVSSQEKRIRDELQKRLESLLFRQKLRAKLRDELCHCHPYFSLYPYQEKGNIYADDEVVVLGLGQDIGELHLDQFFGRKLIQNPDKLTAEQALKLYGHYAKRVSEYERAKSAYEQFRVLISQEGMPKNLIDFTDEQTRQLSGWYGLFQPFFVNALRQTEGFEQYDRRAVMALAKTLTPQSLELANLSVQQFLALDAPFQLFFSPAGVFWREKLAAYADRVGKFRHKECARASLSLMSHDVERARYIVKHTALSRAVADFQTAVFQFQGIFNQTIRRQLVPQREGTPFPELETLCGTVVQSNKVLVLKRLTNLMYHLEEACKSLESLKEGSLETVWVNTTLSVAAHVRDVVVLSKELYSDPYLRAIANELKQKLEKTYHALMAVRAPYVPEEYPPEEAANHSSRSAVLLYVLNVLDILPAHIQAAQENQDLSPDEIKRVHEHAEKTSAAIFRIVDQSQSYVRLFLETPTMYRLFRELKEKLAILSSSSHEAVMTYLMEIQDELFTKMLIEADTWEHQLGLTPGLLADPMQEILDKFLQGFLQPLALFPQRHLAILTSSIPLEKRQQQIAERIASAQRQQVTLSDQKTLIDVLLQRITLYKQALVNSELQPVALAQLQRMLQESYEQARPLLEQKNDQFDLRELRYEHDSPAVDELLNAGNAATKIDYIESLTVACSSYWQGLMASQKLIIDSATEQGEHLAEIQRQQLAKNREYLFKYTQQSFVKKADRYLNRQFGMIHCDKEYVKKLKVHVDSLEQDVVERAMTFVDMNASISRQLRVKIGQFEKENYSKFYQLDQIRQAVAQLRLYISDANIQIQKGQSLFENNKTLRRKSVLAARMEVIASDEAVPVPKRIADLTEMIKKPSFKTTLLDYHRFDTLTFSWLKQCLLWFFKLIRCYTPGYQAAYNTLVTAVEAPVALGRLSVRYGLFTQPGRNDEPPNLVKDALPVAAPA